jgi:hypothetical protein
MDERTLDIADDEIKGAVRTSMKLKLSSKSPKEASYEMNDSDVLTSVSSGIGNSNEVMSQLDSSITNSQRVNNSGETSPEFRRISAKSASPSSPSNSSVLAMSVHAAIGSTVHGKRLKRKQSYVKEVNELDLRTRSDSGKTTSFLDFSIAHRNIKLDHPDFKSFTHMKHLCDGSNSSVFKAIYQNEFVIIKYILRTSANNAVALHEFRMEKDILLRLSHPNIVEIKGGGGLIIV